VKRRGQRGKGKERERGKGKKWEMGEESRVGRKKKKSVSRSIYEKS
jgi:hypothetical protein